MFVNYSLETNQSKSNKVLTLFKSTTQTFGSTTNVRVPNVRVEKHQSGQTQESQTSEWDKRQSGTNVRVGQTSEWTNAGFLGQTSEWTFYK